MSANSGANPRFIRAFLLQDNAMDARVRRSKYRLLDAYLRLLDTENPRDISITDICRNAGINRTTFYANFNTMAEFSDYCRKVATFSVLVSALNAGKDSDGVWERLTHSLDLLAQMMMARKDRLVRQTCFDAEDGVLRAMIFLMSAFVDEGFLVPDTLEAERKVDAIVGGCALFLKACFLENRPVDRDYLKDNLLAFFKGSTSLLKCRDLSDLPHFD